MEVIAALLGAIAAGSVQAIIAYQKRKNEDETILVAIASEVDSICRLIRAQNYQAAVNSIMQYLQQDGAIPTTVVVDLKADYFTVYKSLGGNIGRLRPVDAAKIVNFYAYCNAAVDSTRPDGIMVSEKRIEVLLGNLQVVAQLLRAILHLGDEIIQMPKVAIHGELAAPA